MTIKRKSNKYKFLLILGAISIVIIWGLVIKQYLQRSTLKWEIIPRMDNLLDKLCDGRQLYPPYPTSPKGPWIWPFPAYSPDGQFYVNVSNGNKMTTKWIKMYSTNAKKEIGKYYSKYKSLFVMCWTKDSSGIYVRDHEPSVGFIDIGWASKTGPVKKLLVP